MGNDIKDAAGILASGIILASFILAFAMMKSVPDFDVICKEGSTCIAEMGDDE